MKNKTKVRAVAKRLRHLNATLQGIRAAVARDYDSLLGARRAGHAFWSEPGVRALWVSVKGYESAARAVPRRKAFTLRTRVGSRAFKTDQARKMRLAKVRNSRV